MTNLAKLTRLLAEAQFFLDSAPLVTVESQVLKRNLTLIKAATSVGGNPQLICELDTFIEKFEARLKKQRTVQGFAVLFTNQMARTTYPSHKIWNYMTEWPYGRSLVLYKDEYWIIAHATEDTLSLFHPDKGNIFIGQESLREAYFVEQDQ
jgi:hypothetical protein